jgi:hypothetical protein
MSPHVPLTVTCTMNWLLLLLDFFILFVGSMRRVSVFCPGFRLIVSVCVLEAPGAMTGHDRSQVPCTALLNKALLNIPVGALPTLRTEY